jgi:hypothetical protein
MGLGTLLTTVSGIIKASHRDSIVAAIIESFVGRNSDGEPEAGQDLGTETYPWGTIRGDNVVVNGNVLDPVSFSTPANSVLSGATFSADNEYNSYLLATGSSNSFTIQAASTNLEFVINGSPYTLSSDIVETDLEIAPSSNNTCLFNSNGAANLEGTVLTKYLGEDTAYLPVDTMGSEITSLVGQRADFKTANGEIFNAFVHSTTILDDCRRGFYFYSSNDPIERDILDDDDVITLLKTGFVFLQNDATTVDVSYYQPVVSENSSDTPLNMVASPATGQYWLDLTNDVWRRYNGSSWISIERTLIGVVLMDTSNCIAARAIDSFKRYDSFKSSTDLKLESGAANGIYTNMTPIKVSVYGKTIDLIGSTLEATLETGRSRTNSLRYYVYLSSNGGLYYSDIKYLKRDDLRGLYHPYKSWRCIATVYNDSSNEFVRLFNIVDDFQKEPIIRASFAPSTGNITLGGGYIDDITYLSAGKYQITLPDFVSNVSFVNKRKGNLQFCPVGTSAFHVMTALNSNRVITINIYNSSAALENAAFDLTCYLTLFDYA